MPIYVHAKVCVIDDVWASVGSDNLNRRSWTHDSELSCAVIDDRTGRAGTAVLDRFGDGARAFARELRLELAAEHLGRAAGDVDDLVDPLAMFAAFAAAADQPGSRLRRYRDHRFGRRRCSGRIRCTGWCMTRTGGR